MPSQTIVHFSRVYVSYDPDGSGGGPPVWLLGTASDGSSGNSAITAGVYSPASGSAPVLVGTPMYYRDAGMLDAAQALEGTGEFRSYEVAGLAATDVAAGEPIGLITDTRITRDSWLSIAGTVALQSGRRYFLNDQQPGQITTVCPSSAGSVAVAIGQAISPETLELEISFIASL